MKALQRSRKPLLLVLWLGLSSAAACSNVTVRAPDQGWNTDVVAERPGSERDRTRDSSPVPQTREQCRGTAAPSGWVAVTYLQMGDRCPGGSGDAYNGVMLQRYDDQPVGSVMDICADQRVPGGWFVQSEPAGRDCEGANVEEGEATAVRIRRAR